VYYVIYSQPHTYDLAGSLGRLAGFLGRTKPARKVAVGAFAGLQTLDRILPGIPPRKLLRAAEKLAPPIAPLRNTIRFRGKDVAGITRTGMTGFGEQLSFKGKVVPKGVPSRKVPVQVLGSDIMIPKYFKPGGRALPTPGTTVAHELAHAVRSHKGLELKRKTLNSIAQDEIQTHRLGADIYRKAGGSRLRYWFTNFPAMIASAKGEASLLK
jgi:hypothetical protein